MGNEEPEQKTFKIPSEGEHLFQVVDLFTIDDATGVKMSLDENTVCAKCEVCGGEEEGRSILIRASLDITWKGFFATRLFLKALGEPYKGDKVDIDTDNWIGRQFYATIIHNGQYANIESYSEDKNPIKPEEVAWDDEQGPGL